MSNWLSNTAAFILLTLAISSLTTEVFLADMTSTFNQTKELARKQNDIFVNQTLHQTLSEMDPAQKAFILQLESLSTDLKQELLVPQCADEKLKGQPFCEPDFLSSSATFEYIIRRQINTQLDNATDSALTVVNDKLGAYNKYHLFTVGIIFALASIAIYFFTNGRQGLKSFFGNMSWLALLSALSFKSMPSLMKNLVASIQTSTDALSRDLGTMMVNIVMDWLQPGMHAAFVLSIWLSVIGLLIWAVLKFTENYEVSVGA
ncbi:MAG TPA: hypothetical protein VKE88_01480 [Candidatus Nanoarchaeia archaeon]|nr:hypothetical protein [Candidatus Nanoarchaeia archaeon]